MMIEPHEFRLNQWDSGMCRTCGHSFHHELHKAHREQQEGPALHPHETDKRDTLREGYRWEKSDHGNEFYIFSNDEKELTKMQDFVAYSVEKAELLCKALTQQGITISLECAKWNARQLKGLHYQAGLREDLSTERMHLEYMQELNAAIAKHTGEHHG